MKKLFLNILGFFVFVATPACKSQIDTTTVKEFDLNRFMGRWYEAARFDHRFERGLVGCTADYYLQPEGWVKVVNSGYENNLNGKFKQSEGKARRTNENTHGKLEVSFFWNFYADYNILELAPDYRYALIGSKSDKYLWILSRTPKLSEEDKSHLIMTAKRRGYNTDKLLWIEQKQ